MWKFLPYFWTSYNLYESENVLNETHFYVFPTIPITFPHNTEPLRFFCVIFQSFFIQLQRDIFSFILHKR